MHRVAYGVFVEPLIATASFTGGVASCVVHTGSVPPRGDPMVTSSCTVAASGWTAVLSCVLASPHVLAAPKIVSAVTHLCGRMPGDNFPFRVERSFRKKGCGGGCGICPRPLLFWRRPVPPSTTILPATHTHTRAIAQTKSYHVYTLARARRGVALSFILLSSLCSRRARARAPAREAMSAAVLRALCNSRERSSARARAHQARAEAPRCLAATSSAPCTSSRTTPCSRRPSCRQTRRGWQSAAACRH